MGRDDSDSLKRTLEMTSVKNQFIGSRRTTYNINGVTMNSGEIRLGVIGCGGFGLYALSSLAKCRA